MYQSTEPCPHCGAQNLRGTWVCAHCGNTLLIYCPNCRAANATGSQYCQSCGSPLSPTAQAPTQPAGQQPYPQYAQQGYQAPGQQPYTAAGYGAQGSQQVYQGYQQYPEYGGYPPQTQPGFVGRLKHIVVSTNPILLSALVVLIVGMGIFLLMAFQLHWIKTAQPTKAVTATDTRAPVISLLQVKEGATPHSAIISWVTDEQSSSQVDYGVWPNANTSTPIQNDPTTGTNSGVLQHEVGITNLIPKSSYSYKAISIDKDGNQAESPVMQFDTAQ